MKIRQSKQFRWKVRTYNIVSEKHDILNRIIRKYAKNRGRFLKEKVCGNEKPVTMTNTETVNRQIETSDPVS